MIYGVTHVELAVTDLAAARGFWVEVVGLRPLGEGPEQLELDGGSLPLVFRRAAGPAPRASVRLQAASVIEAVERLRGAGARVLTEPSRTPDHRVEARVADPDGNVLVLWRPLSEDELDAPPELPSSQPWSEEAQALLQALLRHVPAPFRGVARKRTVGVAEAMAGEERLGTVSPELAVRAYIRATPGIMRGRTREALRGQGWDPERFRADYES